MSNARLQRVNNAAVGLLADTGALGRLAAESFNRMLLGPFRGNRLRFRSTIAQVVEAGYQSLPLVALIAFLSGMNVAFQSARQLEDIGAASLIANLIAISVTRELAPVLTAVIVAGRFGAAIAAELGTMKVSHEIDALTVMGIDRISFLVVPRLLSLIISLPCLTIFASVTGILGGLVVAFGILGLGATGYLTDSLDALSMEDITVGLIKAFLVGVIIALVSCQQGLQTSGGAQQVGRATTIAVVRSLVLIIAADLFVTALFYVRG